MDKFRAFLTITTFVIAISCLFLNPVQQNQLIVTSVIGTTPVNEDLSSNSNELKSVVNSNETYDDTFSTTYLYKDNVTVTVNKTREESFKPGTWVQVDVVGEETVLNGSVKWELQDPKSAEVFSFDMSLEDIFEDPNFSNTTHLLDWTNSSTNGFSNISTSEGYLNLTEIKDGDFLESLIYFNGSLNGTYLIEFKYKNGLTGANLTFSYYENGWKSVELINSTDTAWRTYRVKHNLTSNSPDGRLFNFTLPDSDIIENSTSWYIDDLRVYRDPGPDEMDIKVESVQGWFNVSWSHQEVDTEITTYYNIKKGVGETKTYINLTLFIPSEAIVLGDWVLDIIIFPDNPKIDSVIYNAPILVEDEVYFEPVSTYLLRGENQTDVENPYGYYENGTELTVYSPGDNITILGYFYYNSSPNYKMEGSYYSLNTTSIFTWANSYLNITWGETNHSTIIRPYTHSANDVAHGNFTAPYDSDDYVALNFQIPLRGIYGEVEHQLKVGFPSTNEFTMELQNENVTVGLPYVTFVEDMTNLSIRYLVNVTDETLPFNRTWYPTEVVEGSFTLAFWNYNDTLEMIYDDNRTISSSLSIPESDVHLDILLNTSTSGEVEFENFKVQLVESTYYWQGRIDSNIDETESYYLVLKWGDAADIGDTENEIVAFKSQTSITGVNIKIGGSLSITFPQETLLVKHGEDLEFSIQVTIDQLGAAPVGLTIFSLIDNQTDNKIVGIEDNGIYTFKFTVPRDFEVGSHYVTIYKASTGKVLGNYRFIVLYESITPEEVQPSYFSLFGAILIVAILVLFLIGSLRFLKE